MSLNYEPWRIKIGDYPRLGTTKDKFVFILNFAILAPSSHNSQPWIFRIDGNSIIIVPAEERMLAVGDKENRLLFISLGCALKNILIAADFFGFSAEVDYIKTPSKFLNINVKLQENISPEFKKDKQHLIFYITKRSVNRGKYTPQIPDTGFLDQLEGLANKHTGLFLTDDVSKKEIIANAAVDASAFLMGNGAFRKELSKYLKNNLTRSGVGIPAFGMDIPTLISFAVPFLARHFNLEKIQGEKTKTLLNKFTPILGILGTRADTVVDWVEAGKFYQEIALMCEKEGLKTAILAAPVLVDRYKKELQRVCGSDLRPQLVIRIGYPVHNQPHSPRIRPAILIK